MLNNAKAKFSTRRHIEKLTEALEKHPELDTRTTEVDIPLAWVSLIAETEEEIRKGAHPEKMGKQWYLAQKELKKILRRLYSGSDEKTIKSKWEKGYIGEQLKTRIWNVLGLICGVFIGTSLDGMLREEGDITPHVELIAFFVIVGLIGAYFAIRLEKSIVDREKRKTEKEVLSFMQTSG